MCGEGETLCEVAAPGHEVDLWQEWCERCPYPDHAPEKAAAIYLEMAAAICVGMAAAICLGMVAAIWHEHAHPCWSGVEVEVNPWHELAVAIEGDEGPWHEREEDLDLCLSL